MAVDNSGANVDVRTNNVMAVIASVLLLLLNSDKFFLFTNYSVFVAINPSMFSA